MNTTTLMNNTVMNETISATESFIDTITGLPMKMLEPSATTKKVVRTIFLSIGILILMIALANRAFAEEDWSEDEEQEDEYWDLSGDFGDEEEQQKFERSREETKQAEEERKEREQQEQESERNEESEGNREEKEYEDDEENDGQEREEEREEEDEQAENDGASPDMNSTGNNSVRALAALSVPPLMVEPVIEEEPVLPLAVPEDTALEEQERAIRERIAALEQESAGSARVTTTKSRPAIDMTKQAELDLLHERLTALTLQPTAEEAGTATATEAPRQSFWSRFLRLFGIA